MFVENIPLIDAIQGFHIDPQVTPCVMIRIADDVFQLQKKVKHETSFKHIFHFKFHDTNDETCLAAITDSQASQIAEIIRFCKEKHWSIVVHCVAGICRSGAVTDVCTQMGFEAVEGRPRTPNTLVRKKLMRELDLAFDPEKSVFNLVLDEE